MITYPLLDYIQLTSVQKQDISCSNEYLHTVILILIEVIWMAASVPEWTFQH